MMLKVNNNIIFIRIFIEWNNFKKFLTNNIEIAYLTKNSNFKKIMVNNRNNSRKIWKCLKLLLPGKN